MPTTYAISPATSEWFSELLVRRRSSGVDGNEQVLWDALSDAHQMYGYQVHRLGERLIDHCMGVLKTMSAFDLDDASVIACLFHHVQDTKLWNLDDIEERYGAEVRTLITAVQLLSRASMRSRMSVDSLRLMFLRVSDDMRAVVLILCNHTYVLEHMQQFDKRLQRNIANDTLSLFAPVAARLGIYTLKHRMEEVAFPVMYPTEAARINAELKRMLGVHGDFLKTTASEIQAQLAEAGVTATMEARQKQPYSLFVKMKEKNLNSIEDVYDLFALRAIVHDESACYQVLGLLHRMGHPVANRFKDYIAFPKPNGYRSLHTTLVQVPGAPDDAFIEFQIRTAQMNRDAHLGVAAHWSYKEGGVLQKKSMAALQQLLSSNPTSPDEEGKENDERIFVLTPGRDIIELPEGATPLDFAFAIHTVIGLSFKSAKVNGVIVPIDHELENGDIVEIQRHSEPRPSQGWLQYVRTSSARARLKRYLIEEERPALIQRGKEKVNAELAALRLGVLDTDLSLLRMHSGQKQTMVERETLLMKVGQGAQSALSLLQHLDALKGKIVDPLEQKRVQKGEPVRTPTKLCMEGDTQLPYRFARCCKANEGYAGNLIGIVGRDAYVRIHREDCGLTKKSNPERRIQVWWEGENVAPLHS